MPKPRTRAEDRHETKATEKPTHPHPKPRVGADNNDDTKSLHVSCHQLIRCCWTVAIKCGTPFQLLLNGQIQYPT
jgi:hypothetical protein